MVNRAYQIRLIGATYTVYASSTSADPRMFDRNTDSTTRRSGACTVVTRSLATYLRSPTRRRAVFCAGQPVLLAHRTHNNERADILGQPHVHSVLCAGFADDLYDRFKAF